MAGDTNALVWDGEPGHYEVYYLSATDGASGCGLWIRYTMLAPLPESGLPASCSLWLMATDPREGVLARKATLPIDALDDRADPFELAIGEATLTDRGARGTIEDCAWQLEWTPTDRPYEHVHPILRRARVAKTVLTLPHADLEVRGTVTLGERRLELSDCRGGQAHLWGSKHALRWAWAHANDLRGLDGSPRPGDFLDGVSVVVARWGRDVGPSSPVVGRFGGRDFVATSPIRVLRAASTFALTSWRFEASDGERRVVGQVDAARAAMVGVTYTDPDGEHAYCYNSECASMRLWVYERDGADPSGWSLTDTLVADGRAHFEYAQREPVPGMELHLS